MKLPIKMLQSVFILVVIILGNSNAYSKSDDISLYGMHIPRESYVTELKPDYDRDVKSIEQVLMHKAIRIPFQIRNNLFYLQGKINGHPATLLFDTGAVMSGIDNTFAKALGYGELVKLSSLTIGSFERHNLYMSIGNFKTLCGCDAVVGPSVFDSWVVTIDMENHELDISKALPRSVKGVYLSFQKTQSLAQIAGPLITFPATLDGTSVNMCFDTGAGHNAASSKLFGSFLEFFKQAEKTFWVTGSLDARNHYFKELNLGPGLLFKNVSVPLIDNWSENDLGKNTTVNAILGSPVLNDLKRLIIDYPHSRLIFQR